jgi:hypothetical protein
LAEKKQQCLHIGGKASFGISIPRGQATPVNGAVVLHYQRKRSMPVGLSKSFPIGTKGFLYYSMSPERPRIAGELRLRVTSSDDPASFESGSDLLRTDGLPWSRPLYILTRIFPPLYEKLQEERLIPDDLDRFLLTLPPASINYSRSQILYTLNDTSKRKRVVFGEGRQGQVE